MSQNVNTHSKQEISHQVRICEHCGREIPKKTFDGWPEYSHKKFCSWQCYSLAHKKPILSFKCPACGRIFRAKQPAQGKRRFCSTGCAARFSSSAARERFKGENNPRWHGGTSLYPNHAELKKARLRVLQAAGYRCELCGGMAVQTHHRNGNKADHQEANLAPVCFKCHGLLERGRRARTTKYRRLYGAKLYELALLLNCSASWVAHLHKRGELFSRLASGNKYQATQQRRVQLSETKQNRSFVRQYGLRLREISLLLQCSNYKAWSLEKKGLLKQALSRAQQNIT